MTALCPGPTTTGFQKLAEMERSKLAAGKIMDAKTVARIGYTAMNRGQRVVIPGIKNYLLAQTVRVTPRVLVTKIVKRMSEAVK